MATEYLSSLAERALFQRLMSPNGALEGPNSSYRPTTTTTQRFQENSGREEYDAHNIRMHAYQPTTTATMPQHPSRPEQHNTNSLGLDMALSRYGYEYPSVAPSFEQMRNELDLQPRLISQTCAASSTASALANVLPSLSSSSYSYLATRPYQPYQTLNPSLSAPLEWGRHLYTNAPRLGAEDWMSMQTQHPSPPLRGLGNRHSALAHGRAYESTIESNPPSQLSGISHRLATAASTAPSGQTSSTLSRLGASSAQDSGQNHNNHNNISLAIQSDTAFLDPAHVFLRSTCIQVFVASKEDLVCPGRGSRASHVGQIGLRCAFCKDMLRQEMTRQAVCYPSKRDTIFESVRNYQRVHLELCPCMPDEAKAKFKALLKVDVPNKKSQRFVKAYYAEAASELGIVDSPKGLVFGAPPNRTGIPSESVMTIIRAAESPATSSSFWKRYSSDKGKTLELRKFEHLASDATRAVLREARREASAFVRPQDFPTVSDFEFLLYKQVGPCRPRVASLERRGIDPGDVAALSGLSCRHCARVHKGDKQPSNPHKGRWFPTNLESLLDSSINQSIINHMMTCPNVPRELKDAFDELKRLASEHSVVTKRGSKKRFLEKIWGRMEKYYDS